MWPLGTYERMVHEIKRRKTPTQPITFGILIADYRQEQNREYILNYIKRFNEKSGRYIDFFLPGYIEDEHYRNKKNLIVGEKEYFFDDRSYMEFLEKLETDFEIAYPYTPILLLVEYKRGHFKNCKKVRIELDDNARNIKKTGELFEQIFSIAQKKITLNGIRYELVKQEIREGLFESIISAIDNSLVTAIYEQGEIVTRYKLL